VISSVTDWHSNCKLNHATSLRKIPALLWPNPKSLNPRVTLDFNIVESYGGILSLNPRVTLAFNIVESEGKPRELANTLGFR
jgi:hypothetical protein